MFPSLRLARQHILLGFCGLGCFGLSLLTPVAHATPLQLRTTLQSQDLNAQTFQLQLDLQTPRHLLESLPTTASTRVLRSQFKSAPSPQHRQYRLALETHGDRFDLILAWPQPNILQIHVENNWIPGDWILQEIQEALPPVLTALNPLGIHLQTRWQSLSDHTSGKALQFVFSGAAVAGYWSPQGDLWLNVSPHKQNPAPAALRLHADLSLSASPSSQDTFSTLSLKAQLKHKIEVQLSEAQVKSLVLSGEAIHKRLEALSTQLKGHSQFTGSLAPQQLKGQWQGAFQADLDQLRVNGSTYSHLHSYPIQWRWQWPYRQVDDFDIWPELPPLPPLSALSDAQAPHFLPARLQYTIDGPLYLQSLRAAITRARYRVQQEVFVYYPGKTTRALSRLYWLKAAGLQEKEGQLSADPYAPQGISLEIMHNHKMSPEGAHEVQQLFDETREELLQQLRAQGHSPAEIKTYRQRMTHHLQLRALTRGIVKINHRKQVIIDNRLAFVGGFNMADHYLSPQGFHDIMYQLTGPMVLPLQKAFAHNWQALAKGSDPFAPPKTETPRSLPGLSPLQAQNLMEALPHSHARPFFTPQVALLLHDHDQNTLKPALLQLIQEAQHTLRLEQAYVREKEILTALKAAKARGVNLEIVVSYYNDEDLFERLNLASMISLHQAPGAGKVETWLYRGYDAARQTERSDPSYMVHTKYLSADGREAIVGSTNLIPRSLQSPFYGLRPHDYAQSPALFNEELGLWIKDRETVSALDQDLVRQDQQQRSQKVSVTELQALLEARGGLWQLLGDQLKGLFS